jgi:hypothetical protein
MFSGAGFPEAAFASPISVRVIFHAKTRWKDYFMAICNQTEVACMQFFFSYADRYLAAKPPMRDLAGNLKWMDYRVWTAVGLKYETRT